MVSDRRERKDVVEIDLKQRVDLGEPPNFMVMKWGEEVAISIEQPDGPKLLFEIAPDVDPTEAFDYAREMCRSRKGVSVEFSTEEIARLITVAIVVGANPEPFESELYPFKILRALRDQDPKLLELGISEARRSHATSVIDRVLEKL